MFNTSVLCCPVLLILSALRIIFSIPVPDDYSDKLPSILASPELDNYSEELISTSTITHTSPVTEEVTTELQNVCNSTDQWAECVTFLEKHLNKDSKEYKQLQDLKDRFQSSSLPLPIRAAIRGYTELIQILVSNGVPVNRKFISLEETVFYIAAEFGHDDLVIWLLTQGADIQAKNMDGETPFHMAVCHSNSSTVKKILDAGADVNVTNNEGETPLLKVVKFINDSLYIYRSKFFLPEYELKNLRYENYKKIIELLLEYGADANIPDYEGNTPLHVSSRKSNLDIVKLLIYGGANINATNKRNQTPLHIATESNNLSVVEYLVAMGCDKTITDLDKKTAIVIAEENNFIEIVDLLSRES